ncbi:MAG TPA: HemK/PrmC family methyltransferase [Gemmatimonadaceae bacterium]|nr:HemK/PrmC family methyltransferase [Gemmatimonadaceae bacterium]
MLQSEVLDAPEFEDVVARLGAVWSPLPDKPEETLELTAKALWFAAAGDPQSVARCADAPLPSLNAEATTRLWGLLSRRSDGTPLAHLTGRQNFAGLELLCGPGALIPRRETELLARTATDILSATVSPGDPAFAIDVCTGSGNVALAMAAGEEHLTVLAADISSDALALAVENARYLGLGSRVTFIPSDLFNAMDVPANHHRAAVITCNPPYIASAKVPAMAEEISRHEPRLAFDGGAFGLTIISRLLADAPRFLRPGGSLCFEVGAGNGRFVAERISRNGAYVGVRQITDEKGIVRVLVASVA